jgi:hypothetical protein
MQGLAEVEGNPQRVTESRQRIERDIGPLSKEVKRQLDDMGRSDLFGGTAGSGYQAPGGNYNDMDRLLSNSEDMLRGSLAYVLLLPVQISVKHCFWVLIFSIGFLYYLNCRLCADSEEVGTSTLLQMGRQREQLETTSGHIDATRSAAEQAGFILRSM